MSAWFFFLPFRRSRGPGEEEEEGRREEEGEGGAGGGGGEEQGRRGGRQRLRQRQRRPEPAAGWPQAGQAQRVGAGARVAVVQQPCVLRPPQSRGRGGAALDFLTSRAFHCRVCPKPPLLTARLNRAAGAPPIAQGAVAPSRTAAKRPAARDIDLDSSDDDGGEGGSDLDDVRTTRRAPALGAKSGAPRSSAPEPAERHRLVEGAWKPHHSVLHTRNLQGRVRTGRRRARTMTTSRRWRLTRTTTPVSGAPPASRRKGAI